MVKAERDKLAQCKHKWSVEGTRWFKQCGDCGELLSLGEADEPGADVAAGRLIAFHGGLADDENLYLHDGGAIAVTTGDQDDAMAWSLARSVAEQIDEVCDRFGDGLAIPDDRPGARCDWHAEHGADDKPTGQRCESAATHRIVWLDGSGRFSLGCGAHLELDAKAPPVRIERLDGTTGETCLGFDLSDTELVAAIAHSPPREPNPCTCDEDAELAALLDGELG